MDKCLFCDCDLSPGSEEHVFLSSIGGRIKTRKATCVTCNNAFAGVGTGKIDDVFAKSFLQVRNGLKIWTGRDGEPPTIFKAGRLADGSEFDLAPAFIPIVRKARIPDTSSLTSGSVHTLTATDEQDAKRVMDILSKKGFDATITGAYRVREKAPLVKFSISFSEAGTLRSAAKTAVLAVCMLYGNELSREKIDRGLLQAIRYGSPDIGNYTGWDYINPWPIIESLAPHPKTPDSTQSGYEHSVVIANVHDVWIAYLEFFGGFRFSLRLGGNSGLAPRGLAINPRSAVPARFVVAARPPGIYEAKNEFSYKNEVKETSAGVQRAFKRIVETWKKESEDAHFQELSNELMEELASGDGSAKSRAAAIRKWAEKIAITEMGARWAEKIDIPFDDDP